MTTTTAAKLTRSANTKRKSKKTKKPAPTRDELIANLVANEVVKASKFELTVYVGSVTLNIVATA